MQLFRHTLRHSGAGGNEDQRPGMIGGPVIHRNSSTWPCLSRARRNLTTFTILSGASLASRYLPCPLQSSSYSRAHFHLLMFISRLRYCFALVATILVLVTLGLLCKTNADFHLRLQIGNVSTEPNHSNDSKAWIYSVPVAEDKAVILAKIHGEDVSWVFDHLPEYVTQSRLCCRLCADEDGRQLGTSSILHG